MSRYVYSSIVWSAVVLLAVGLGGFGDASFALPSSATDDDPGEAYFHRAAQHYLAEEIDAAREVVREGLEADPNHPKLNALRERLDDLPPQGDAENGDEADTESEAAPEAPPDDDADADPQADEEGAPDASETDNGTPDDANGEAEGAPEEAAPETEHPDDTQPDDAQPDADPPEVDDNSDSTVEPGDLHTEHGPRSDGPSDSELLDMPTLTPEQVNRLLRITQAYDRPLMHAFDQFGTPPPSDAPEW